jgi:hypothetical protein
MLQDWLALIQDLVVRGVRVLPNATISTHPVQE